MNKHNSAYQAISAFYGDRRAERSGVPLIYHIEEGLAVLKAIGASLTAEEAFCIHPMLQADADLKVAITGDSIFASYDLNPEAIVVAMEYRAVANSYLSRHCITGREAINLGVVDDVRDMLIADKVQNRKDFEIYHLGRHAESDKLVLYFDNWMVRLNITPNRYVDLCEAMVLA